MYTPPDSLLVAHTLPYSLGHSPHLVLLLVYTLPNVSWESHSTWQSTPWCTPNVVFPGTYSPCDIHATWYSLDFLRYTINLVPPGVYSSCDMHSPWYSLGYTVPVIDSTWCSLEYTIPAICTKRGTPWSIHSLRITLNLVLPGIYSSCDIHSAWYSLEYTVHVIYTQLGTPWSIQFLPNTLN